nr:MAG: lipid membrane protein [Diabrotica toursvirus 3a]
MLISIIIIYVYINNNMGAAASQNSSKIITKAISKITEEIIQEDISSQNQSIAIKVEKTKGNVTISNINAVQRYNISMNSIFTSLTSVANDAKINQEIAQLAKSLISGLNLGQVSISSSTISSIIENCIEIKNSSISSCKHNANQSFLIKVIRTKGDVKIRNLDIIQESSAFVSCLQDSSNKNVLRSDTDLKISQVSSATAEGLDIKWIVIGVCVGLGGVTFAGGTVLKSVIGPGLLIVGIVCMYLVYRTKSKDVIHNEYAFITEPELTDINSSLSKISKTPLRNQNDDVISYGEADLYEIYSGNVTLYSEPNHNIVKFTDNLNFDKLKLTVVNDFLHVSVPNSRYIKQEIQLPKVNLVIKIVDKNSEVKKNVTDIYVSHENFEFTHKLKLFYNGDLLSEVFFEPTIIITKSTPQLMSIVKSPIFIVGIVLSVLGIFISVINAYKK